MAKEVFVEMWKSKKSAKDVVASKGMSQITDPAEIGKIIDGVLAANAGQLAEYRAGKVKLLGFFVGQSMKASKGQANPDLLNQILLEKLKG